MINKISWVLRLVVAIIYIQTLYFKFTGHPDSVKIFSMLGLEPYGRIGLGVIELMVAFLILMETTKFLGMVLSVGIISGAIVSHLMVLGIAVEGDGGKLFLLAILVFVSSCTFLVLNRKEGLAKLNNLKRLPI